jgi:hypothetical protein
MVKRWFCTNEGELEEAQPHDDMGIVVLAADYDALEAEMAAMTKDRDYHRASAINQSVYWRTHHEERIAALEAELTKVRELLRRSGLALAFEPGPERGRYVEKLYRDMHEYTSSVVRDQRAALAPESPKGG